MDCGCTNCTCDDKEVITSLCPECGSTGNLIPEKAVKANLKKEFNSSIKNVNIFLCPDEDCQTSYYSEDNTLKYNLSDSFFNISSPLLDDVTNLPGAAESLTHVSRQACTAGTVSDKN